MSSAKRSNYWPDRRVPGDGKEQKDGLDNFTYGSIDSKRYLTATPEAASEIEKLQQSFKKTARRVSRVTDTTFRTLESVWGEHGSWSASVELPKKSEEPCQTRKLQLWPKNSNGGSAAQLLTSWGLGVLNTKGCKGTDDRSIGQDACSISRLFDGSEVFCVMDGHGPDGHWPAERSVRSMPFFLQGEYETNLRSKGSSELALTEAFRKVQKDLEHWAPREDIGLLTCGTTAVCVLHQEAEKQLWVATCGDSRCVLIVPGVGLVAQTRDHKPSDPEERKRLEASGCEVEIQEHDDGWREERVYVQGQRYPGLSMTRSLGDVIVEDKGVYSKPEVVKWSLAGYSSAYVLMASDGVWEFMSSAEVAKDVLDGLAQRRTCQQIVKDLILKSKDKWDEADPEYMDDITAILVPLDGRKAPLVERRQATGCFDKLKECFGL